MKKSFIIVSTVIITLVSSLGAFKAHATVAPSPCAGCSPPGAKCCTSSSGDDYYGKHS